MFLRRDGDRHTGRVDVRGNRERARGQQEKEGKLPVNQKPDNQGLSGTSKEHALPTP